MNSLQHRWQILVGILILGGIAWLAFGSPMLVDFQTDVMTDRRVTIWNPLRDREPESIAAGYLRRIHVPNCSEAVSQLNGLPLDDKMEACTTVPAEQLSSNCVLWQRYDDTKSREYWINYHCRYLAVPTEDELVETRLKRIGKDWNLIGYRHSEY